MRELSSLCFWKSFIKWRTEYLDFTSFRRTAMREFIFEISDCRRWFLRAIRSQCCCFLYSIVCSVLIAEFRSMGLTWRALLILRTSYVFSFCRSDKRCLASNWDFRLLLTVCREVLRLLDVSVVDLGTSLFWVVVKLTDLTKLWLLGDMNILLM